MGHFWWQLWFGYTYPSLKGNGPEAVVQIAVGFVLAVVFWPPLRRRIHQFADTKLDRVHADLHELHAKVDKVHEHLGIKSGGGK